MSVDLKALANKALGRYVTKYPKLDGTAAEAYFVDGYKIGMNEMAEIVRTEIKRLQGLKQKEVNHDGPSN